MRALVTGSDGFIGTNLCVRLEEAAGREVIRIGRRSSDQQLVDAVAACDIVFHLAGVNRPQDPAEFMVGNRDLTARVASLVAARAQPVPVILASSIQAERDNPYGQSKRAAEAALLAASRDPMRWLHMYRLPNVFGKWCRPNYNSAVATFCHNIARGLPITIHDPSAPLQLVYVDDVVSSWITLSTALLEGQSVSGGPYRSVTPVYSTTVGEVASAIEGFHKDRKTLGVERVGIGLMRALYATYLSAIPPEEFSYPIVKHGDPRGVFAEMLRTTDSGQVSFFTAHPGITRGGHYHHTKNEKFLVVRGNARFGFRHVVTGERFTLDVSGEELRIVDTVPGWAHDITNTGQDELVVLLWANERFDREHPDTITAKV